MYIIILIYKKSCHPPDLLCVEVYYKDSVSLLRKGTFGFRIRGEQINGYVFVYKIMIGQNKTCEMRWINFTEFLGQNRAE